MNFSPVRRSSLALSVTTNSAANRVSTFSGSDVLIWNMDTANAAYVEFGADASTTAVVPSGSTPGSMPIPPGGFIIVTGAGSYLAAVTAAGTASLVVMPGNGN